MDERDHVPEHAALRRLRDQEPLADCKLRRDADAEVAGILADVAAVTRPQLLGRQPLLPAQPDVLALVLADRAPRGFAGVVRRTGAADSQGVSR